MYMTSGDGQMWGAEVRPDAFMPQIKGAAIEALGETASCADRVDQIKDEISIFC